MHVKKGDKVKILTGKDAGKTGEVLVALPKLGRVVVSGVNIMKRHMRPRRQGEPGQVIDKEMPLNASNVMKTK
ncbi:MAG: 50S ribosomal protein L24 [Patescibacteria group bacterium]|nr:50S ribosomal protein L24 [Patescibacteria group bacterium]MDE2116690.1 50S ribosomal protein L24 [Patescibacteria group bacterium]